MMPMSVNWNPMARKVSVRDKHGDDLMTAKSWDRTSLRVQIGDEKVTLDRGLARLWIDRLEDIVRVRHG